jgi:hypothetical protein
VVIGLQSTGEAATDSLHLQPGDVCGFISTTRQMLVQFVEAHFPTTLALEQQQQEGEGKGGQHSGAAAADSGGRPPSQQQQQQAEQQQQQQQQQGGGEEDATSVQLKASMLERIADLDLPPNFLDQVCSRSTHTCLPVSKPASAVRLRDVCCGCACTGQRACERLVVQDKRVGSVCPTLATSPKEVAACLLPFLVAPLACINPLPVSHMPRTTCVPALRPGMQLIDELGGAGNVAEMTGRKARVVRNGRGRLAYTLRAKPDSSEMDSLNIKEKQQFMDVSRASTWG